MIPDSGVPDLMANNWFVTATYHATGIDVHYAGRLELVPEPAPGLMLSAGAASLVWWRWFRSVRRQQLTLKHRDG